MMADPLRGKRLVILGLARGTGTGGLPPVSAPKRRTTATPPPAEEMAAADLNVSCAWHIRRAYWRTDVLALVAAYH